ncbi:MAG: Gfo/Idh/MocA family oxidoreductase [Succinatimonas sp.]|nr:Gfo/Idh/MocA family oxidoreductase [Succinatimonas sp.]
MLKFGILGAGKIAGVMATTINMMIENGEDICLWAVGSRSKERSQEFAQKYNIKHAYDSYESLVADPKLDLVYIATPHNLHYENALLCMEHGKHVLCEKAFTVNALQAKKLCDFAKEHKLLLAEAIWTRFMPMRQMINEELASGIIGNIRMLTANLSYPMLKKERLYNINLAGGALLDVGIYPLNFANMILGTPDRIDASCIKSATGVDLSESMTLTYESSARMAVLCSTYAAASDRFGFIHGESGYMQVENINNPQGYKIFNKNFELIKEVVCPKQLTGYEYEVRECMQCIKDGLLECPSMPHQDTLNMMNQLDTIRAQFGVKYPFE